MKKGKIAILLSSVAAGLALVGTTFAAWAITDNADPLNIGISPGEVQTGQNTYSEMTLEWGTNAATTFVNISNLANGTAGAQYNSVVVKSNSSGGVHGGNLTLTLTDATDSGDKDPNLHLIDKLVVEVYTSRTGAGTELDPYVYGGQIEDLTVGYGADKTATKNIGLDGASQYEQPIYFKYYIPDGVLSPADYTKINKDQVNFEIDWNRPSTIPSEEIGAHLLHVYSPNYHPYLYAWDDEDVQVAPWPGQAMTSEGDGWYTYGLLDRYNHVIISNNGADQTDNQTIDTSKLYFNGEMWLANKPEYYVVSYLNTWGGALEDSDKLTYNSTNKYFSVNITTPAVDEDSNPISDEHKFQLKVKDVANNIWYGEDSHSDLAGNYTWGQANTNITIKFSPFKKFNNGAYYIEGVPNS